MAICPFARQRLLPESRTQPAITPRIAILHSAAGRGSLYGFFLNSSNLESHFWIGDDGTIEQYVDTGKRADANLKANNYAISIETESSVQATERWSPASAASIVKLLDWICVTHKDVQRQQCDAPAGTGIGWHIMFGAPGPWTPVAKSCPGPARIVQARNEIIPAVVRLGNGWQGPPFPGVIRPGAVSDRVQKWAVLLSAAGYRGFNVTGQSGTVYGKGKELATRRFQKRHGLKVDGVVGPQTWAAAVASVAEKKRKANAK